MKKPIKIRQLRLVINVSYGSIRELFHQSLKKTARCREVILAVGDRWGHALLGVAVVER